MLKVLTALKDGMEDYTINERGDVGSWIRIACINGCGDVMSLVLSNVRTSTVLDAYLPAGLYHQIFGRILKQGVERLDNVRLQAGQRIAQLLELPTPNVSHGEKWCVENKAMFERTLAGCVFFEPDPFNVVMLIVPIEAKRLLDGRMDPGYFLELCSS